MDRLKPLPLNGAFCTEWFPYAAEADRCMLVQANVVRLVVRGEDIHC